ncbi:carboxypeptidase-like regulatory domain-containing protein [Conexibacter arvalis]|uniref:carboxypeptidase-like regulatory domain-containing protein n=1 Tax=Conexibacter arvalis TaxID=912552 RepID=UPI001C857AA5|nr:carboxypeptidase-like regulatory domain-containing protein [Conexibacter arvalis]
MGRRGVRAGGDAERHGVGRQKRRPHTAGGGDGDVTDWITRSPVATVRTDADGDYGIFVPDGVYDLDVVPADPAMRTQRVTGMVLSGAVRHDVTLTWEGWVHIALQLEAPTVSVAGAAVEVGGQTTTTGPDGRFDLWLPQGTYPFSIVASDGRWQYGGRGLVATADIDASATLPPETTLTVGVTDARDGRAIEGAAVSLPRVSLSLTAGEFTGGLGTPPQSGETDADGEVVFTAFLRSHGNGFDEYGEASAGPRFVTQLFDPGFPVADGRVDIALAWRPLVTGTVTDASGQPVEGLEIGDGGAVTTGPDGTFSTYVDPRTTQGMLVSKVRPDGRGVWYMRVPVDLTRDSVRDVRLPPEETDVMVRVVDPDGRPIEGAVVAPTSAGEVTLGDGTVVRAGYERTGLVPTGADGLASFRLFDELSADGRFAAAPRPDLSPRGFLQRGPITTITLLDDQTWVTLAGVLAPEGEPLAGATVTLGGETVTTDADGWFMFTVQPGEHAFGGEWRAADGAVFRFADPTLDVGADQLRTLSWSPRTPRTVAVVDQAGRPAAGAVVTLPDYADASAPGEVPAGTVLTTRLPSVVTDADGEAVFQIPADAEPSAPNGTVDPPSGSPVPPVSFPAFTPEGADHVLVRLLDPGPSIALDVVPPPSAGDWWTVASVAVQVTATDAAGVRSLSCAVDGSVRRFAQTGDATTRSGSFDVRGEGRHVVTCAATDALGNESDGSRPIGIDRGNPFAPTLSADRPADSANGWFRDTVTVSTADDGDRMLADGTAGSGVDPDSVPAPQTFATSGRHIASGAVRDRAGRVSPTRWLTVKVDADAPSNTLHCPAGAVTVGTRAKATWAAADAQSGLQGPRTGSVALDTSSAGSFEVAHTAVDRVGHRTTSSCTYEVV